MRHLQIIVSLLISRREVEGAGHRTYEPVRSKDGGHDHQPADDRVQQVRTERIVNRVARYLLSSAAPAGVSACARGESLKQSNNTEFQVLRTGLLLPD